MFDLDTICPVQFIEGRNKFAELGKPSDINSESYIEYIPQVSYSVSRIDILIGWPDVKQSGNNRLVVYADYLDHPTDIILTEGNMAFDDDEPASMGWRTVNVESPVVLIAHKRYWLKFSDIEAEFYFVAASKGDEIITRLKPDSKWETKNEVLMLRCYGRILPIALLH